MDERELLILNPEPFVWQHKDKDIAKPFTVSKFFFDIDGGYFQIKEGQGGSGARRFPYKTDKITLKIGNGAVEGPFPNEVALLTRLRQVKYPGYYYLIDAMGLISTDAGNILAIGSDGLLYVPNGGEGSTTYIADGENTTVTGTGTSVDPYQINVPNVGGSQNLHQTLENGTSAIFGSGDLETQQTIIDLGTPLDGDKRVVGFITGKQPYPMQFFMYENTYFSQGFNVEGSKNGIITIDNGNVFLSKTTSSGVEQTTVGIQDPTNITSINAPAPTSDGDYYFGTTINGQKFDSTGNINIPTGGGTVTSVTGVSNETTVANGTTTPVIGISSVYTAARDAVANAKVENNLTASTTVAPSKTAVNTALALKANLASPALTGTPTAPTASNGNNSAQLASTAFVRNSTKERLFTDNSTTAAPLTTTESIIHSYQVPANAFRVGTVVEYYATLFKPASDGTSTYFLYVNTTNSLVGALPLGSALSAAASRYLDFSRRMKFKSGNTVFLGQSQSVATPTNMGVAMNSTTTQTADVTQPLWFILTCTNSSATNVVNLEFVEVLFSY